METEIAKDATATGASVEISEPFPAAQEHEEERESEPKGTTENAKIVLGVSGLVGREDMDVEVDGDVEMMSVGNNGQSVLVPPVFIH